MQVKVFYLEDLKAAWNRRATLSQQGSGAVAEPGNPYPEGSPREAWRRGYNGETNFGAKGSDYDRQYREGAEARRTAPPAQQEARAPLTREQLKEAFYKQTGETLGAGVDLAESVCRVVEAAHGIAATAKGERG